MTRPRWDVNVPLLGEDGNAFAIVGRVRMALRKAGASPAEVKAYSDEAMSGDYDHVLQTTLRWVHVAGGEE